MEIVSSNSEEFVNKIYQIRGQRVMLDFDLAEIYGVETKVLKQAVRRNMSRFPVDFMFELTKEEFNHLTNSLRSQIVTSSYGGRRYSPFAFTEHGAVMLASVLNSEAAVQASIVVVRAFVKMKEILTLHADLAEKITELEEKFGEHDEQIALIIKVLHDLQPPKNLPRKKIGFIQD
jgi:phage regulator Rha-like protein